MITSRTVGYRQCTRIMSRSLSSTSFLSNSLPSTPEMRSSESWSKNSTMNSNSITSKVVGIARSLQETTQAPISIDSAFTKKFSAGDSYDPFDFSNDKLDIEKRLYRSKNNAGNTKDPFEQAGIDPCNLYTMPEILSRFLTSTGQILPREVTGCSAKNQKKLSAAIKRARCCGLLASTHKHSRYIPKRNM